MFKPKKNIADLVTNQQKSTSTPPSPSKSSPSNPSPVADSPKQGSSQVPESATGLLVIKIVEARNLASGPTCAKGGRKLYCVIEFDRNEILVNAKENADDRDAWQHRVNFDVSRETDVVLSVYERANGAQDSLIGTCRYRPKFADQQMADEWLSLQSGFTVEDNKQGDIRVQTVYKKSAKGKPLTMEEFELLKVIGKGSFGKVMQVRKRDTNRIYAMKIIRKAHIVERAEVSHTLAERAVLAKLNHPFIVPLKFSFQTAEKLYLVLAFVNGGELFHHLQKEGRFSPERARFYTAELLTALDCLHSCNIVYRDLKPENILLDYTGHIALCDFGLCKLDMKEGNKTNTFCGTPEYLAPELLLGQGYTKVVDWWTLGILLYEMITGLPPFYDENVNEMYRKILTDELKFPDDMSDTARDLLSKLLNRDPTARLGCNGAEEIKKHPFFAEINWPKLLARKYQPPFRPNVTSATDTSNFDEEFTSEIPMDSVSEGSQLSDVVQQQFAGFTYQATNEHMGAGSLVAATSGTSVLHKSGFVGSFTPSSPAGLRPGSAAGGTAPSRR
ncbi:kinase-like domain-containing protein [Cladochytrium replicatum]|nr:kinase-like domain-containing protein [Cladochytrium replicatum]